MDSLPKKIRKGDKKLHTKSSRTYETDTYIPVSNSIDNTDINIIRHLLKNPDAKSNEISTMLKIPLSTIQRRRARLEGSVLKKKYEFDIISKNYRLASLHVNVEQGRAEEIGKKILVDFPASVLKVSTRINSNSNLAVDMIYKDSKQLHDVLENIKSIHHVSHVDWSELVRLVGDNTVTVIDEILSKSN
jgi:DNA-binding Lrp family transcriptional regulator